MLCSECIAEHLEVHREANSFPRIKTLKQVKADMADKLDKVTSFINENSPEHIDIQTLKNRSSMQIEEIRRQLIQIVD